ncbi:collagen alpha-1(I) chain [Bos taurus]|uniref:collagen alpha-1(I) chain n=1 Tax=Bos taurus TaxID=9913 RepID=UPI0028CB58F0|nr:collagen alpha-1(I) chain-like [Bos taurus]
MEGPGGERGMGRLEAELKTLWRPPRPPSRSPAGGPARGEGTGEGGGAGPAAARGEDGVGTRVPPPPPPPLLPSGARPPASPPPGRPPTAEPSSPAAPAGPTSASALRPPPPATAARRTHLRAARSALAGWWLGAAPPPPPPPPRPRGSPASHPGPRAPPIRRRSPGGLAPCRPLIGVPGRPLGAREMKASLRRIPTVEPREIQLRSSECYRFSKYPFKKKSPYLLSLSSNMEVLFSSKVCDEEHEPWSWANCSFECSCASNQ